MSNNSIGFGGNNGIFLSLLNSAFISHTNTTGNSPVGSVDDYDVTAFYQAKQACKEFQANIGVVLIDGVPQNIANGSMVTINDMANLSTVQPQTSFTSIPAGDLSSIDYISKVGVMAIKLEGVASGTTGSLLLNPWLTCLTHSQYELYIKYFSSVVANNVAFTFDLTGLSPLSGDDEVKYRVSGLQNVTADALNPAIVLTADGQVSIAGVSAASEVINTVKTTVYTIRMFA